MKALTVSLVLLFGLNWNSSAEQFDPKADFAAFCSGCHPDGGNMVNPARTLRRGVREGNGIRKPADIVRVMRKPGPGMRQFTKKDLSNKRARALADYIMTTY